MNERCCSHCRSVPGVCARQRQCTCHIAHEKELKMRDNWRRAQEAAFQREEQARQASREESARMQGWAPWR